MRNALGYLALLLLLGIVLLTTMLSVLLSGDNAVTIAAKQMAAHLNLDCLKTNPNPDCVGDASFDASFPHPILDWRLSHCSGCLDE